MKTVEWIHPAYRCHRPAPRGWFCSRFNHAAGPCALWARWWNLRAPSDTRAHW
jgi:hypothetical protein